jgi:hypothetical protein
LPRVSQYVDDDGCTWEDDQTIDDEELLLRRVHPSQIVPDANRGGFRPSSAAFDDDDDGHPMSVYLDSVMEQLGLDHSRVLDDHPPTFGVAGIAAGACRDESQVVVRDPEPGEPAHTCDPAHAVVAGPKGRKLRPRTWKHAVWWLVEPEEYPTP